MEEGYKRLLLRVPRTGNNGIKLWITESSFQCLFFFGRIYIYSEPYSMTIILVTFQAMNRNLMINVTNLQMLCHKLLIL